ncbi:uncharacterized protein LOC143882895 [Tasmannia lanceolata]|uniref:uncharacterized protein LOC143882895 n=1 Tax=Tasmannia lanceolata TaxID=3420 RepID=UPI004064B204
MAKKNATQTLPPESSQVHVEQDPIPVRSTRERIAGVEERVTAVGQQQFNLAELTEGLGVETKGMIEEVEERVHALAELLNQAAMEDLRKQVETLTGQVNLLMRTIGNGIGGHGDGQGSRVRVPEPRCYAGARDAKELQNFLFHIEQFFRATHLDEEAKVTTASMYLSDDAKLWWRTCYEEIEAGRCIIDSWEDMKRELKAQFMPENVEFIARKNLRRLQQTGSIREYVKKFSTLMLDIKSMSEEDKLFQFMEGLKPWSQTELRRRGVQNLATAMIEAEKLFDHVGDDATNRKKDFNNKPSSSFNRPPSNMNTSSRSFSSTRGRIQGSGGDRRTYHREGSRQYNEAPTSASQGPCFICTSPHYTRFCPKKGTVNALLGSASSPHAQSEEEEDEEEPKMTALSLCSAIKGQGAKKILSKGVPSKGLMYIEACINGKMTRAMIDTGATHNFVSEQEAKRLALKLEKDDWKMKAVNSEARPVTGKARSVPIKIGAWSGTTNLMAVPLDDFHIILGIEFLNQAKAVPMPYLNSLCMFGEKAPCMIPATRQERKDVEHLTALQLKKGLKKGEPTFVATLKMGEALVGEILIPPSIKDVIEEFKDVMPEKLPKKLPPRRAVDHKIELEPGSIPPARAPYRMAPPELAELRRQLNELLEAGFLRPS